MNGERKGGKTNGREEEERRSRTLTAVRAATRSRAATGLHEACLLDVCHEVRSGDARIRGGQSF